MWNVHIHLSRCIQVGRRRKLRNETGALIVFVFSGINISQNYLEGGMFFFFLLEILCCSSCTPMNSSILDIRLEIESNICFHKGSRTRKKAFSRMIGCFQIRSSGILMHRSLNLSARHSRKRLFNHVTPDIDNFLWIIATHVKMLDNCIFFLRWLIYC